MAEEIEQVASLDDRVVAAKNSKLEIERFIEDYKPFLHARVAKYSVNADSALRDELLDAAMVALYESVQNYNIEKGHFFKYAERIVHGRLIDHLRDVRRHEAGTVPLEPIIDEDDDQSPDQSAPIVELSMRSYDQQQAREALADEIEQFRAELTTWGITMEALSLHSPKHKKLRESYKQVIMKIAQNDDIIQTIQLKRYFPVKAIAEISGLPQKNVERARLFVLATLIIRLGDYKLLSEYVSDDP